MESNLDTLMYQAGMTAQGCWDDMDSYDQEAVLRLIDLVVNQCITLVEKSGGPCQVTTFDQSIVECTKHYAVKSIQQYFNIEESVYADS